MQKINQSTQTNRRNIHQQAKKAANTGAFSIINPITHIFNKTPNNGALVASRLNGLLLQNPQQRGE